MDPIQSTKGDVVMECFRTIGMQDIAFNRDPRSTTSNTYHTCARLPFDSRMKGAGKLYYNMVVKTETADTNEVHLLQTLNG
jgi:hypothetical protein